MTAADKPLSDSERRRFEEIEKSFAVEDPMFSKRNSMTSLRKQSWVVSASLFGIGLVFLLAGLTETGTSFVVGIVISLMGFGVMVTAVTRLPRFRAIGRRR